MHVINSVVILNHNGRDTSIVSASQLRRLGEQEGFDPRPFVAALQKESR
jgi:hypothetical protein